MSNSVADPGSAEAITCADFERGYVIDRRAFHRPYYRPKPDAPIVFYDPPKRSLVTGITLHQTAADMGSLVPRYDTLGAHWAVLRDGRCLKMADADRVVIHGNGWNARCVGIEVVGRYAGIEGQLWTLWDDPATPYREQPQQLTDAAAASLRMLVRYLKLTVPTINVLCSHRQSSATRRSDPGQAIWREAVRLHAELGMTDGGPGFKLGDGRAIPREWNPSRTERY